MRPEERDPAYLWDMREAARAAIDYTETLALEEFLAVGMGKEIIRLAVERQLEILGEAARKVSPRFREEHPEIPWHKIVGLRNLISHEYDKVNYAEIYRIVRGQIPELIVILDRLVPLPPPIVE